MKTLENQAHRQHNAGGDEQSRHKGCGRLVLLRHGVRQELTRDAKRDHKYDDGQQECDDDPQGDRRALGLTELLVHLLAVVSLTTAFTEL